MNNITLLYRTIRALIIFSLNEIKRGTFLKNISSVPKMKISVEMSWGELIEEKSKKYDTRHFLTYKDEKFSYRDMNYNANKIAHFFLSKNARQGEGVALLMDNSPKFLHLFFGLQKIGMYIVPVNTSLRGESLLYILNHCDVKYLVMDDTYIEIVDKIKDKLKNIKTIIINNKRNNEIKQTSNTISLSEAEKHSTDNPAAGYSKEDICFITYTSGTTGLPKGVVYRYKNSSVKLLSLVANLMFNKSDILYTCMKLFHGNALFVTTTCALHVGASMVLAEKFSASGFWDEIREFNVTTFNTIGAMIPIMMKQPEKSSDNDNKVRFIISAACPPDLWKKFEKRYGLNIYETYGAVDGGGKTILNLGNGPVGSIGKPPMKMRYRLIDENKKDVPDGEPGELVFIASEKKNNSSGVEYYKNEDASKKKESGGLIYTGDLMRRDKKGYLYFVGRNTESMRIKGENVSAYEVEQTLIKHPHILEAAVYAVPSELAEDDIMASISLVDNKSLKESGLIEFAKENLPKFAVPRYIKIVEDFPKTETHRIIKKDLEKNGILKGTFDSSTGEYC